MEDSSIASFNPSLPKYTALLIEYCFFAYAQAAMALLKNCSLEIPEYPMSNICFTFCARVRIALFVKKIKGILFSRQ